MSNAARNCEYNPAKFQAAVMRIREPRTTALVFKTGKIIVAGAKKEKDATDAVEKYAAIITKMGYPTMVRDVKIQNINATCDAGFPIRLEGFIYDAENAPYSTYEPELFPGLVYRMAGSKVVMLIFISGKVVVTGAKCREDVMEAVQHIHGRLLPYRRTNLVITAATR